MSDRPGIPIQYKKLEKIMKRLVCISISVALFVIGCVPADQEPLTNISMDVRSSEWQNIYGFQDNKNLDSLLRYTSHSEPTYRYMVANGLASIRDMAAVDSLEKLLQDPVMKVRVSAAYALGQLKKQTVAPTLLRAFRSKDTLNIDNEYNGTILESVGKTAGVGLLESISTVSSYRATDTLLLLGQARAIYRFALRGHTLPEGTDKMIEYVTDYKFPNEVRTVAANYLYRAQGLKIDDFKFRLAEVFSNDQDPNIRMALAGVLGKIEDNEMLQSLLNQLKSDSDYRVKVNIIRALKNFKYEDVIETVLDFINDKNVHIANTAADFLISNGNKIDAVVYRGYLSDTIPASVNAKIYSAVLKHVPVFYTNTKAIIKNAIVEKIKDTENDYEKSAYLAALGYDVFTYETIDKIMTESNIPVVQSTGMEALKRILLSENFVKAHRGKSKYIKRKILDIIKTHMERGDVGALAVAGDIISHDKIDIRELIDSVGFIKKAQEKLNLPSEIETYNSLGKALASVEEIEYETRKPDYNHPIDYSLYESYGDSVYASIKTDKGLIKIKLFVTLAPGSVSNFMHLVNTRFYNGKVFHRVVPNFVIQAGCPRGDGYGSLDYTIRSEVGQAYYDAEGYVGMASAGPDTEGTQWFITHSPTMHLDGNYTIFAKVVEGMEVVHQIEVGDKIQDIIITN